MKKLIVMVISAAGIALLAKAHLRWGEKEEVKAIRAHTIPEANTSPY